MEESENFKETSDRFGNYPNNKKTRTPFESGNKSVPITNYQKTRKLLNFAGNNKKDFFEDYSNEILKKFLARLNDERKTRQSEKNEEVSDDDDDEEENDDTGEDIAIEEDDKKDEESTISTTESLEKPEIKAQQNEEIKKDHNITSDEDEFGTTRSSSNKIKLQFCIIILLVLTILEF